MAVKPHTHGPTELYRLSEPSFHTGCRSQAILMAGSPYGRTDLSLYSTTPCSRVRSRSVEGRTTGGFLPRSIRSSLGVCFGRFVLDVRGCDDRCAPLREVLATNVRSGLVDDPGRILRFDRANERRPKESPKNLRVDADLGSENLRRVQLRISHVVPFVRLTSFLKCTACTVRCQCRRSMRSPSFDRQTFMRSSSNVRSCVSPALTTTPPPRPPEGTD